MRYRKPDILLFLLLVLSAAAPAHAQGLSVEDLVDRSHWKRAKAILEPRVQANPNDAQALFLLSQVRQTYGDLDDALKLAEKAAALNPRNGTYRWQVGQVVGEIADKSGNPFRKFGMGKRVRREAEAAIAADPRQVDARWGLMEWNMEAGMIGGDKKVAYQLAQQIAALDPAQGYLAQARLLEMDKKQDSPETLYLKAIEADPKNFMARMKLAEFYSSEAQRKYAQAEKFAQEASRPEPDRVWPYLLLARVYATQNRWQDLDTLLAQAETALPDNLAPYYQAASTLLHDGKELARAERYLRKYLSQEPEPDMPRLVEAQKKLAEVQARIRRGR